MTITPYQHQKWTRTEGGLPSRGSCAPTPAVVHYDAQERQFRFLPPSLSLTTRNQLGGALVVPSFLFHVSAPLSLPDSVEPWRGRVGFLRRCARRIPSRSRPVGLHEQPIECRLGRSDHTAKYLSAVPHNQPVLSSVCSRAGLDNASKRGRIDDFLGQKGAA